jgi:hypothetical protein
MERTEGLRFFRFENLLQHLPNQRLQEIFLKGNRGRQDKEWPPKRWRQPTKAFEHKLSQRCD